MIKVKLYELEKHRNECAFRPYLWANEILRDVGIELTTGDSYDYAWVAQASIIDKKVSLEKSVENGLEFLSNITGDYMILDGQDSTSLIGTYEVFKESDALLLLKNSLLKDRSLYKEGWNLGRYYWGSGDYKLEDFDKHADRIVLSGTNWISTHWASVKTQKDQQPGPFWLDYFNYWKNKKYDLAAMYQYPSVKDNYEHGFLQSSYYDEHRAKSINVINELDIKVAKLENGKRVSESEYYSRLMHSKIILAPLGYGEMAPRDFEAAMFGAVLIKPDMSYIDTVPNVFIKDETYIACNHDFSDLSEKIEMILGSTEKYHYIIENARSKFEEEYTKENLATHVYRIFESLNGVSYE
jgi:hypothetical protein